VRLNIQKSGREIDIEAKHRTEARRVIAECKATSSPIGGDAINKFAGVLDAERRSRRNDGIEIEGYFISLSGFTETAIEQENELGQRIVLLNSNQIVEELVHGRILVHIAKAMERAGRCAATKLANMESELSFELLAHESGWVWAIYFSHNKEKTHYALIHADGEPLSIRLAKSIVTSDTTVHGSLGSLAYLPPHSELVAFEDRIPEAETKYFEYLLTECGEIQLEGLPADQEAGMRRLKLENIFVPLYLEHAGERDQLSLISPGDQGRESLGRVLHKHSRLAILAPPGGGKSTLLKRLAIAYAFPERLTLADDDLPSNSWFPLFIRCRQLGALATAPIKEILCSIPERAELSDELAAAFVLLVDRELREGNALLLVDGLDEIFDEGVRIKFIQQLRTFLATYPNVNIVVTSREVGFRVVGGSLSSHCKHYRLADFDEEDIRRLTSAWHREVVGDSAEVRMEVEKLVKSIWQSDRVRQLARNPLLLTTLLLVKRWVGQLPSRRSVLYGKAIEVLLMTWNVAAWQPIDQDEAIPQLAFLAFKMMCDGVQEISLKNLRDALDLARKQMPEVLAFAKASVGDFIERVESRSSLLMLSGHKVEDGTLYATYEFRHLTFQEYLAARAIADGYYPERHDSDTLLSVLEPHLLDPQWKEVVPLAAVLAGRRVQPIVERLIEYAIGQAETHESLDGNTTALFLLSQCIIDEIQIPPDLLEKALECIASVEPTLGLLTIPIVNSRYGEVMVKVVQEKYAASKNHLLRWGDLLGLVMLSKLSPVERQTRQPLETDLGGIETLLDRGTAIEKAAGAFAVGSIVRSLRTATTSRSILPRRIRELFKEWIDADLEQKETSAAAIVGLVQTYKADSKARTLVPEPLRELLKGLVGRLASILNSEDPHLYFAASWAFGWFGEGRIWTPLSEPEVLNRLVDIWRQSTLAETQEMAALAFSRLPIIDRDKALFINHSDDLIDFVEEQYSSVWESGGDDRRMASLALAFYCGAPWTDEELAKLLSENFTRRRSLCEFILERLGTPGKRELELLKQE